MRLRLAPAAGPLLLGVVALLAAAAAPEPRAAADGGPRIEDVTVDLDAGRVLVSFALRGAFDDELRARLESGLPTELTFEVELLRDRKRWFDKEMRNARLQVVAMYNALTREYLVNTKVDGRLTESRVVGALAELEPAMTEVAKVPFFVFEEGDAGQRMRVRVQAELGTRTVFFFVPTTRATPWSESPKFRAPGERAPESAPPGP